ncbi:hypothetical protein GJ744_004561 [Endocarpon pusillum]|uniref:MGS207 protein n=1 Tax=Endocarpon pusillum TaxID=364733 RepID=A0A8H7AQZ9_9EURO|nr:hypothetical protein GJ744_004561 [Endocarpon pusillum]
MFAFPTLKIPSLFGRSPATSISLPPVPTHDIEASTASNDRTRRRLKHLLKLNHVNHAILFHHRHFHNHAPHILGSAYMLGCDAEHLNRIYDREAAGGLVPWEDSPGEVARYDWRDFLGRREYERAFVDFFEDMLVLKGFDWRAVVEEFLFDGGKEGAPLVNNLVCGLGHPLIHLGYAYELNSREVAMEALGLAATNYNHLHKYLDDPKYSASREPRVEQTADPLDILERIQRDQRLDHLFSEPGGNNLDVLFAEHEPIVLEYWNAWKISEPKKQFEQTQQAAVALLISAAAQQTCAGDGDQQAASGGAQSHHQPGYDFFLLHLLTTSHSVRILLPCLPEKCHLALLRQWFLLTVALYIAQLRPLISIQKHILDYDVKDKDWAWVVDRALTGEHALDAHFVKGLRAMKVCADTWGDGDHLYLNAAVRFATEFAGWGGFSAEEVRETEVGH